MMRLKINREASIFFINENLLQPRNPLLLKWIVIVPWQPDIFRLSRNFGGILLRLSDLITPTCKNSLNS